MDRPLDKHLDNAELDALVPTGAQTEPAGNTLSAESIQTAKRHVARCVECEIKVRKYSALVSQLYLETGQVERPGADCPRDVDWREVAIGLWPEFKATQLLSHAAVCDHCGPLLRTATRLAANSPRREHKPAGVIRSALRKIPSSRRPLLKWVTPLMAVMLILGALIVRSSLASQVLSAQQLAEFAVNTHRQHAEGNLALDVHSESQQELNQWFKAKSPFAVALPDRPAGPDEVRPYQLEGARLVRAKGKSAVFIAYQLKTGTWHTVSASLMIVPASLAVASGGVEAGFQKVIFHYSTVQGYKVVTWTQHGLTYVLVSSEGNKTQRSCMVCHSAMRDRDLSEIATPLPFAADPRQRILQ